MPPGFKTRTYRNTNAGDLGADEDEEDDDDDDEDDLDRGKPASLRTVENSPQGNDAWCLKTAHREKERESERARECGDAPLLENRVPEFFFLQKRENTAFRTQASPTRARFGALGGVSNDAVSSFRILRWWVLRGCRRSCVLWVFWRATQCLWRGDWKINGFFQRNLNGISTESRSPRRGGGGGPALLARHRRLFSTDFFLLSLRARARTCSVFWGAPFSGRQSTFAAQREPLLGRFRVQRRARLARDRGVNFFSDLLSSFFSLLIVSTRAFPKWEKSERVFNS